MVLMYNTKHVTHLLWCVFLSIVSQFPINAFGKPYFEQQVETSRFVLEQQKKPGKRQHLSNRFDDLRVLSRRNWTCYYCCHRFSNRPQYLDRKVCPRAACGASAKTSNESAHVLQFTFTGIAKVATASCPGHAIILKQTT